MNILAPVNSLQSVQSVISSGAEEIYVVMADALFNTYSFTGRGKITDGMRQVLPPYAELNEIVQYSHQKGVSVNFVANMQFFHNGLIGETRFEKYFLNYIESGLKCGVDSLIIGDIGVLYLLHKQSYRTSIHGSIYLKTINSAQLSLLKELGVTRTTLSYHMTMDEIKHIAQKKIMEIEVIGYLGCSFYNGACGFLHEMGETATEKCRYGIACKNTYNISKDKQSSFSFDVETGCAVCSLDKLERAGVSSLKIVGRDRNIAEITEVIGIYKKNLTLQRMGKTSSVDVPKWWQRVWCCEARCKYLTNRYTPYRIGDTCDD